MSSHEALNEIMGLISKHNKIFRESIPLIASENLLSKSAREALVSDLGMRYAEGWPGERVYAGCQAIDEIEIKTIEQLKKLFNAAFADVRPISGVVANLTVYTAFTKPGDTMMAISIASGGHISMGPLRAKSGNIIGGTAGAVHGLEVEYLPFDHKEMNIDVAEAEKRIKETKPQLVQFGASVFLFPHPVKELAPIAHEVGARVNFDAAHVSGLIAGDNFQDPLREGADSMSFSTHKTFFGPQHGAVVLRSEEFADDIKRAAFPGMTSNHHLHNVAALSIAASEFEVFGKEYTTQIVKNSKALAQALYDFDFNVVAADKGFTESHIILVDVSNLQSSIGLGGDIEKLLEKCNIIVNRNLLPWDIREKRSYMNPGGIRLGTSELTRLGMKEGEMERVAEFIKKALLDKQSPKELRKEVLEFKKDFMTLHYTFDEGFNPYLDYSLSPVA